MSAVCRVDRGVVAGGRQLSNLGSCRCRHVLGCQGLIATDCSTWHRTSQPHARTWLQGFSCSVVLAASSARPAEAEGAHWLGQRDLEVGAGEGGWGCNGISAAGVRRACLVLYCSQLRMNLGGRLRRRPTAAALP